MKSRGKLTDMDLEDRVDMDNKFDDVKMIESLVESYKDQGLPIGDLVQAQLDQVNSHWCFQNIFQKRLLVCNWGGIILYHVGLRLRELNQSSYGYVVDNIFYSFWILSFNTQYMTNPTIAFPVKMEYERNFSISGLKIMVKSGLETIFLKFLHAQATFY